MIDGGVWTVLDKYNMPFLKSMNKRRILYSRFPVTQPAVATIMTGCDPHDHGITGFTDSMGRLLNTSNLKKPFVWDTLDVPYGVVNIPGTYPLRVGKYALFMMSGFDSPHLESGKQNYYPDNLKVDGYIIDLLHVKRVHPNNCTEKLDKDEIGSLCNSISSVKTDFVINWASDYEPTFLAFCFAEFDRLMHFCYGIEKLERSYCETLDLCMTRICDSFKPDEVLIFSDHGFTHKDDTYGGMYYLEKLKVPLGINMLGIHNHFGILACKGDRLEQCSAWNEERQVVFEKEIFKMVKSVYA